MDINHLKREAVLVDEPPSSVEVLFLVFFYVPLLEWEKLIFLITEDLKGVDSRIAPVEVLSLSTGLVLSLTAELPKLVYYWATVYYGSTSSLLPTSTKLIYMSESRGK